MIEVCLEQRSTGIMTGTTLSKAQRSVPEARLDRHCLEQRSTEQIGTPTITTRHYQQYTHNRFTFPYLALQCLVNRYFYVECMPDALEKPFQLSLFRPIYNEDYKSYIRQHKP
jgi:hypothetical protein